MPTPTYTPLATVTLGSSATSVTFSSIPATYRDLIFVFSGTITTAAVLGARANGDTGSNYTLVRMVGTGSSTQSSAETETYLPVIYSGSPSGENGILQILDYSASDKHKTALTRANGVGHNRVEALASRWANTAVITSLTISGPMGTGSTLSLYGIAA
jgi:hypothetical protein